LAPTATRENIFTVVRSVGRKPSGMLMVMSGFGPGDLVSGVFGFVEQRDGNVDQMRAELAQIAERVIEDEPDIFRDDIEEEFARDAKTEFAGFGRAARAETQGRFVSATNEDGIEEESGVGDGARQRANAIKAGRERNHAGDGDAAEGGFEADDAAERGGDADGAAGVRADAAVAEARRDGGRRAAAGAAGNAGEIPRIAHGTEVGIIGSDAIGELVHVGLAEEDRTGFFELRDDLGVVLGNEIFQNF
jgi:hypothetical protein